MHIPSLIIAGDLCLQGRPSNLSSSQLLPLLDDIKPILLSADASLVNLETAVINQNIPAIQKAGPIIGSDKRVLDLICKSGFTGVTLANNHFADYGPEGVEESLQLLDEYNLWYVGAGMNVEMAAQTKYLQVGDKKVAIINACEHEFTIARNNKPGCNALNPIRQYAAIQEARAKANNVIVIIHGGVEYYSLPTPRMQETYRFFIDAGADAVVNHHQHCYSGSELYKGKPIVYGLGNFFFDWQGQEDSWYEGYMVNLQFGQGIDIELIPYIQNHESLGIKLMQGEEKDMFNQKISELNKTIQDSALLHHELQKWAAGKKEEYMQMLEPLKGKNVKRLERLHLIAPSQYHNWNPEYFTAERCLLFKSLFQCESHQEIMNILFNTDKQ